MRDCLKAANRRHRHLRRFLNAEDSKLPSLLVPIEELNWAEGFCAADCTGSPLGSFHPRATRMVLCGDDYFLGCRADHFVLLFGQTEAVGDDDGRSDCVVRIANHKGALNIAVFGFKDDVEVTGCGSCR
jgi:hypothetical protein